MKKSSHTPIFILFVFCFSVTWLPVQAQKQEPLKIETVAGNVLCLYGPGGNIGILKGETHLLLVDSKYDKTAVDVQKKIRSFCSLPVLYLINTHYHGDHTGGNAVIGKDARIISHEKCRASLVKKMAPEESPESLGLPDITIEKEMVIHFGDEIIRLIHFGPGHTAGDIVVIFERAKVVHTGDLFFNGMPPYIDVKDGSDTHSWIQTISVLAEKYPDYTVIPGHGPVTDMKGFLKFADYLKYLRTAVGAAIKDGKTRTEAMDLIDLSLYEHLKERGRFLTRKNNLGWIYDEMVQANKTIK